MEGVHDRSSLWHLLACGVLEPGETVHGHHLDPPAAGLVALGGPGLKGLLGTFRDHVQQVGRTRLVTHGGQVDDDGDVFAAPPGWG